MESGLAALGARLQFSTRYNNCVARIVMELLLQTRQCVDSIRTVVADFSITESSQDQGPHVTPKLISRPEFHRCDGGFVQRT